MQNITVTKYDLELIQLQASLTAFTDLDVEIHNIIEMSESSEPVTAWTMELQVASLNGAAMTAGMYSIGDLSKDTEEGELVYSTESLYRTAKVIGTAILNVLKKIFKVIKKLYLQHLSNIALLLNDVNELMPRLNSQVVSYDDTAPDIPMTTSMIPIYSTKSRALYTAPELARVLMELWGNLDPSVLLTSVAASLTKIQTAEQGSPLSNAMVVEETDHLWGIIGSHYFTDIIEDEKESTGIISAGTELLTIVMKKENGQMSPPSVTVKSGRTRAPKEVKGFTPQECFAAAAQVSILLERSKKLTLGDAIEATLLPISERLVALEKEKPEAKEVLRMLPKWVNFVSKYSQSVTKLQYLAASAVMDGVKASSDRFQLSEVTRQK